MSTMDLESNLSDFFFGAPTTDEAYLKPERIFKSYEIAEKGSSNAKLFGNVSVSQ